MQLWGDNHSQINQELLKWQWPTPNYFVCVCVNLVSQSQAIADYIFQNKEIACGSFNEYRNQNQVDGLLEYKLL